MKRILTYIFGLIIMAAPFAPSTADNPITGTPTTVTVTGTVLDNKGAALIGATVIVVGTYNGTATDLNGDFTITKAPSNATLSISYVGYTTQKINLSKYTPAANEEIKIPNPIILVEGTEISEEAIIDATGSGYTICRATDNILIGTSNKKNCAPCACKPGYLLTDEHMAPASYTIKYTGQEAETTLNATKDKNNICPNTATYGCADTSIGPQCVDGGLPVIFEETKKFQCIQKTSCHGKEVGVEKSEYVFNTETKTYTCEKICRTENGYVLNKRNNKCEPENKCNPTEYDGAADGKYVGTGADRKCVPSSCNCGYKLEKENTAEATCTIWTEEDKKNCTIKGATETYRYCFNGKEYCHAVECDTKAYEHTENTDYATHTLPPADASLTGNKTKPYTCIAHERKKCNEAQRDANKTNLAHSTKSSPMVPDDGPAGEQMCLPTECECNYKLINENKTDAQCIIWSDSRAYGTDKPDCDTKPEHAADGQYYRACRKGQEYCHIDECEGDYEPNNSNDACVGKRGECTPSIANPQHHKQIWDSKYKTVKGVRKCVITKCATGYEPNKDGSDCTPLMVLPEKESQDRIDELRTVYDEAHKNETSIANKTLGAASMAATGAGGMMLASGLTEQKADKEAEEKMRGYVATFKCNYGNTNVEYGTQPTELPMSTELYNLYAEYVTLANDLKLRKEMLGLRAGIESEKILDSATTGLYDDVSSGRSAGMYTSLARAILDPNGADAAAWAEQTKRSKNLIIAGATTAGVGVVGSIVSNQLINKDAITLSQVKKDIEEINGRYTRQAYSELFDSITKAANDSKIEAKVNLVAKGKKQAEVNPNASVVNNPANVESEKNGETGEEKKVPKADHEDNKEEKAISLKLSIPTSILWNSGEYAWEEIVNDNEERDKLATLLSETITALNNFIDQVNNQKTGNPQITANTPVKITVNGHTDTKGQIQDNKTLSQKRADTMMGQLSEIMKPMKNKNLISLTAEGKGENECTCQIEPSDSDTTETKDTFKNYCSKGEPGKKIETMTAYNDKPDEKLGVDYAPCRRVDIIITPPQVTDQWFDGEEQIDLQRFINQFNPESTK